MPQGEALVAAVTVEQPAIVIDGREAVDAEPAGILRLESLLKIRANRPAGRRRGPRLGGDVGADLIGECGDFVEWASAQQAVDHRGGEGVPGSPALA
jgi:hypothetical protein